MATLLFPTTHGSDDPERATVPYIAAATAAISGHEAIVVCTADAVEVGLPDWAEAVEEDGVPPLVDLLTQLLDAGGQVWLCSACTSKRGITADRLRDGPTIVGAARIVEALAADEAKAITLT